MPTRLGFAAISQPPGACDDAATLRVCVRIRRRAGLPSPLKKEDNDNSSRAGASAENRQTTTRGKTGRISLQLLEGAVNPELTEYASQEDQNFEPYSPPATPRQWQLEAMATSLHDHSGDMPQWWPDATAAATEDSWWLHNVWNTSTTLPVCRHCMWTILVNKDMPYEQLDWAQQSFISLMVTSVNMSDLRIFK